MRPSTKGSPAGKRFTGIFALTLFFLVMLPLIGSSRDQAFEGKVVAVFDGDTLGVLRDGRQVRVRLRGIDCPERKQPWSGKARKYSRSMVYGKTVRVVVNGVDKYDRMLVEIFLPDGRSLNRELVASGLAWWYRHYSDDAVLESLEAEARMSRRGLWSDPDPVAPWEWRRINRRE